MIFNKWKPVDNICTKFRGLKICGNVKTTLPDASSDILSGLCISYDRFWFGLVFLFVCFLRALEGKFSRK